jgi:hypothetical protein
MKLLENYANNDDESFDGIELDSPVYSRGISKPAGEELDLLIENLNGATSRPSTSCR